jgi:predicted phosphodiesterase
MPTTVGLISDTHGLLRASAMHALEGVALILHAGDVDDIHTPELEARRWLTVEGWQIHVSHGHEFPRPTPELLLHRYRDAGIIVFGHTHRALVHRAGDRLVVNPGAAGPKRFDVVPSVAKLTLSPGHADVDIIGID